MVITSFLTLLLLLDSFPTWAHQVESFQAVKTVADSIGPTSTPIVLPDREIERSPDIHSGCFFHPKMSRAECTTNDSVKHTAVSYHFRGDVGQK